MCGITGYVDFNNELDINNIKSMTNVLAHRGPDSSGVEFEPSNEKYNLAFGHRRLSIIDLKPTSNQPFFNESKDYWLVFNGEIYNYLEIRNELISLGYKFKTNSDTEVVLRSYIEWGVKCVDRFIGMFAFSIFDKIKNKLFIFRDRAGVKPVNYYYKNNLFIFSSEIKSFHKISNFNKELDLNSVAMFFRHGYIHSPNSIYKNVKKVKPGQYIEFCLTNKKISTFTYWDAIDCYNKPKLDLSLSEAKQEMSKLFKSAFNYRMVSDVPVGVFLSGGYDSSTTAAILSDTNSQKINTFTIGFNDSKYDESENAEKIAKHLGTNHQTLHFKKNHLEDIIKDIPFYYDEPFGDSSSIPSILVSKLAKKHVSVVLSSDGGDELFAGYGKHFQHVNFYKMIGKTPNFIKNRLSILEKHPRFQHRKGIFSSKSFNDLLKVRLETIVFTDDDLSKMLNFNYMYYDTPFNEFDRLNESNDYINKLLAIDYKTYLENDILTKVDRATMSQSIEGREPFLDHRLLEFCSTLDSSFKYNKGVSKYLLKEINKEYIPDNLMDKTKKGFGGPVDLWLKESLANELNILLNSNEFPSHILNQNYLIEYVTNFNKGRHNNWYKVYQIYSFLSWFKYWN
jgi:asparagine synthase (glutamine-hydrolysing)